jgi:hypothetical protein
MRLNIKTSVAIWLLILVSCQDNGIRENDSIETTSESKQEQFIRKLYSNKLLATDSIESIKLVITSICLKTRYVNKILINNGYDSAKLNFYIINSKLDSSLRNLCAFAGRNTIFLDRVFLDNYTRSLKFFKGLNMQEQTQFCEAFQYWVIGHEIAHADLGHLEGHFINSHPPKTQEVAKQFHSLELAADKKCLSYIEDNEKIILSNSLCRVFNSEYELLYGSVTNNNKYLKFDNDPYLTFPYKLDGSHPSMPIRTAIMLYLISTNSIEKQEAYNFLIESQLHFIKELNHEP